MLNLKTVKVNNMESPRTGKPVANQYIIEMPEGTYFQSYKTIIAFEDKNRHITLHEEPSGRGGYNWDCSATTLKYLKQFIDCNYTKKEIEGMIKDGTFSTADLN
jgi:hypothetical protein